MRISQTSAIVASLVLLASVLGGRADSTETARDQRTTGRIVEAPACVEGGRLHLCFSSPADHGGSDPAVVAGINRIFDTAGAGDSLRIAMFRWDIASSADALVAAQERGAHVELVVDRDVVTNRVGRNLVRTIENGDPSALDVVVCRGACLPWRGSGPAPTAQDINHLKLIIAEISGQQSVTTTSLNLEGRQYVQANSLLQMFDASVYAYSLRYFERLRAQSNLGWDDGDKRQAGAGGSPDIAVYPSRTDLLISTLRQLRCAKGMNTIDVMHAVIQRYDIRAALGRLQRSGCRVRIVVTRDLIENWLESPFTLPGGDKIDLPDRDVKTLVTHDKVYAIHARRRGKEAYLVVTGNSNATCGGLLYNDEMMVRLRGKWVWEQYRSHVLRAFRNAHHSRIKLVPVQDHCR